MTTLPATIAIGPIRYRVSIDKGDYHEVVSQELVDIYGRIDYGNAKIVLKTEQATDHVRLSLLHEVLHGCWHLARQDQAKVTEEEAIRFIAAAPLDTLRRNPDFISYLLAEGDA